MFATPAQSQSPDTPLTDESPRAPANPPPKITRGHSCLLCQQRKVKCDRQKPCSNCLKARTECIVSTPAQPRRRRRNPTESDLVVRLKRYEQLLKSNGIKVEGEDPNFANFKPSTLGEDDIGINDVRRLTMNAPHRVREVPGALFFGKTHAQYVEKYDINLSFP